MKRFCSELRVSRAQDHTSISPVPGAEEASCTNISGTVYTGVPILFLMLDTPKSSMFEEPSTILKELLTTQPPCSDDDNKLVHLSLDCYAFAELGCIKEEDIEVFRVAA